MITICGPTCVGKQNCDRFGHCTKDGYYFGRFNAGLQRYGYRYG